MYTEERGACTEIERPMYLYSVCFTYYYNYTSLTRTHTDDNNILFIQVSAQRKLYDTCEE